jgi:hypothetical protein
MMTRKDYVATAEILKNFHDKMEMTDFVNIVWKFSDMFSADNPRFDKARFEFACWEVYKDDSVSV